MLIILDRFVEMKRNTSTLGGMLNVEIDLFQGVHQRLVIGIADLIVVQQKLISGVDGNILPPHFRFVTQQLGVLHFGVQITHGINLNLNFQRNSSKI